MATLTPGLVTTIGISGDDASEVTILSVTEIPGHDAVSVVLSSQWCGPVPVLVDNDLLGQGSVSDVLTVAVANSAYLTRNLFGAVSDVELNHFYRITEGIEDELIMVEDGVASRLGFPEYDEDYTLADKVRLARSINGLVDVDAFSDGLMELIADHRVDIEDLDPEDVVGHAKYGQERPDRYRAKVELDGGEVLFGLVQSHEEATITAITVGASARHDREVTIETDDGPVTVNAKQVLWTMAVEAEENDPENDEAN